MAGLAKKWMSAIVLLMLAFVFHEFLLPIVAVVEGYGFYIMMTLGIQDMPLVQFYTQYRNWVWFTAELIVFVMALGSVIYVLVSSAWGDVSELPTL